MTTTQQADSIFDVDFVEKKVKELGDHASECDLKAAFAFGLDRQYWEESAREFRERQEIYINALGAITPHPHANVLGEGPNTSADNQSEHDRRNLLRGVFWGFALELGLIALAACVWLMCHAIGWHFWEPGR